MNWRGNAQSAFQTIIGHHLNEQGAIVRGGLAKAFGLDPAGWASPYTQHNVTYVNVPQEEKPDAPKAQVRLPTRRTLERLAIAAALGGGMAIAIAGTASLFNRADAVTKIIDNTIDKDVEVKSRYVPPADEVEKP